MKAIRLSLGSFLFVALSASTSMAQGVQRSFVSGLGNDGNPCSRTAPCRTFAQAISQTVFRGEVIVLDSAGYGAATITQSVTIAAPPGVYAGISVFSGDGIDVNTDSGGVVTLRGLTITNQGGIGNGIAHSCGTLRVERCTVTGFIFGAGILSTGGCGIGVAIVEVKDSTLSDNNDGIDITGTSAVAIDHVRLEANADHQIIVGNGARGTVRNSIASAGGIGFHAFSNTTATAELNIESCVSSNNGEGTRAQSLSTGIATVRVSNSTLTDNIFGLVNYGSPALLLSRGNNTVEGNGTDTSGIIGSYTAK